MLIAGFLSTGTAGIRHHDAGSGGARATVAAPMTWISRANVIDW
jgi:hypothetical protein